MNISGLFERFPLKILYIFHKTLQACCLLESDIRNSFTHLVRRNTHEGFVTSVLP
jgi:hypothetical protein